MSWVVHVCSGGLASRSSGISVSGADRQLWIRFLPSGSVTNGCSLGVAKV